MKRVAKNAKKTDAPLSLINSDDDLLGRFIEKYELEISKDSVEYGWLEREMKLSAHEFAKAVLAYDKSLRRYNFEEISASPLGDGSQLVKMAGMTIAEIASAYLLFRHTNRTGREAVRAYVYLETLKKGIVPNEANIVTDAWMRDATSDLAIHAVKMAKRDYATIHHGKQLPVIG